MLNGLAITAVPHVVFRGTFIPDTVRCVHGLRNRSPSYTEQPWAQYSSRYECYVDVRANAYILGTGPRRVTILLDYNNYYEGQFKEVAATRNTTEEAMLERFRSLMEDQLEGANEDLIHRTGPGVYGREVILFVGPGANVSTEVWQYYGFWDVQMQQDGTVLAVHPHRDYWQQRRPQEYQTHRAILEMTLPAFSQAVTAANAARIAEYGGRVGSTTSSDLKAGESLPMLITDINRLGTYLTGVSAAEDDPPAKPAPACGVATSATTDDRDLRNDCQVLLAAKDALRGTGTLNWATATAITAWDGITVAGTPSRVTKVKLANKSLTGTIPEDLTRLDALTEIKLAGNTLTGCIPAGLRSVALNDLRSLSNLYCAPTPQNFMAGNVGEHSAPLTWDAITGVSKYRLEYRPHLIPTGGEWVVADAALTSAAYTVGKLDCETGYQFRLSSHGDGTAYEAAWGVPSTIGEVITTECVSPVFRLDPYEFAVAEDAAVGDAVGTVSAIDPDVTDRAAYSISGGNTGNAFAIGAQTGAIIVAAALDHETAAEYTLTVQASDGTNATTATVVVSVTDVSEDPPPAPSGLAATLVDGIFTVSWTALDGAAKYEAQHTTDAADAAAVTWTSLPETTGVSVTYAPDGGPAYSTEYRFRVRAYGDGTTYTEMWGAESDAASVETAGCAPAFDQDSYNFEAAEDAAVGDAVGTVSATDPDEADNLTYSITAGNTGSVFAIDGGTGAITVAVALDYETTSEYTLTVEASDGNGGTDTAAVTVTVTDVAEDAPPAPTGLSASLAGGTFTLFWTALDGAAKYEVQHTTDAADAATVTWTALPETTGVNVTYAPDGGPACSAEYRFRVRAYGDGDAYTEMWGAESDAESVETATCDPEFGQDPTHSR